jgi:hypothetical protein
MTAAVLGVLTLVLLAAGLVLSALCGQLSVLGSGPIVPIVVVYAAVGFVVARRQPGNPIGWILGTASLCGGRSAGSAAVFAPAVTAVARHDVRIDAAGDLISTGQPHGGPSSRR